MFYENLRLASKNFLGFYCCYKLYMLSVNNIKEYFIQIYRFVFFRRPKKIFYRKHVDEFIFELIDYLKIHGVNHPGIFRIPGNKIEYENIFKTIETDKTYEFEKYGIDTNAAILKLYIRKNLNGLIQKSIVPTLNRLFLGRVNSDEIKIIEKYFPFTFCEDSRKLLLAIFDMFTLISNNSHINRMTLEYLFIIFSPTIFPEMLIQDLEIIKEQIKFLNTTIFFEYNRIPDDIMIEMESFIRNIDFFC
ncbi:RhoGAP domain-containing protein [Hamiltosporidium tvaerminnensis]|uniref:RhoGAP domain-containing protein n=2 Tax=Hamiltosporidium TaxID=1176354 RepID=A0A4Q9LLR3_9MICR|nr:RhoGAP domain-containing protein [Hamiltosporidium magnivora]TBU08271.1 RhoGAP domain-containing protein [Hamiltosporidium magnivora]TBU12371.1 RhoGAP domain-containing protein [Hamiltosporidium tvaerminnensis]